MPRYSISVSNSGRTGTTIAVAASLQERLLVRIGVELMPFHWEVAWGINQLADQKQVNVSCLHALAWEVEKTPSSRFLNLMFEKFFGTLDTTSIFDQARGLDCPVLMHGTSIQRLRSLDLLHRLEGLDVLVENGDTGENSFSTSGDRSQAAIESAVMLRTAQTAKTVSLCLDVGHLATEVALSSWSKWSQQSYIRKVKAIIWSTEELGLSIGRAHIHDWAPIASGWNGRDHLHLGSGELPVKEVVSRLLAHNQEIDLCLEMSPRTLWDIMAMTLLPNFKRAHESIANEIDLLEQDFSMLLEWTR